MPATLHYFSINADDLARAKAFYERVLGWTLQAWGPPGYYEISIAGVATAGLHERHELVPGRRTNAFRTTFEVDDIDVTLAAVAANGGRVLMQPHPIENGPTVGYFEDTEGNVCGVGQYPRPRRRRGPPTLRHFAINADDVGRGKAFYEHVFGWAFTPWGPPNFYQVQNAGEGLRGALQERRALVPGERINAFETTFEVADIRATLAAAAAWGGRMLMQPYFIEGVGEIGFFEDTEGNVCGVGQYLPGTWP